MFRMTPVLLSSARAPVEAVVVGGGPAGLAVVGNLLQALPQQTRQQRQQLWVDPSFTAGRVNAKYREVPSNTKVDLFLQFARALEPFRKVIERDPSPNAIAALEALQQDKGCELGKAADMCAFLTEGLAKEFPEAEQHTGLVTGATLNKVYHLQMVLADHVADFDIGYRVVDG